MRIINPDLGVEDGQNTELEQGDAEHKPKRVTVGFKIDEETHGLGLELFPLRGQLAWVIRDIFLEQVLDLKNDPAKLKVLHQRYMEHLKVRRRNG